MGQQRAEANRINAQRSSGPRTELGKSRSKMNALKHGLSAKKIVIGDEDPKEFETLPQPWNASGNLKRRHKPNWSSSLRACFGV
jgi:hypothetical protein